MIDESLFMRLFICFILFISFLTHLHAINNAEVTLTDEQVSQYESRSTEQILSLIEHCIVYLENSHIDLKITEIDRNARAMLHFKYYPYNNDDAAIKNLSNKYNALVLVETYKRFLYTPDDILLFVSVLEEQRNNSLFVYEIVDNKKSLKFDYSGYVGIIDESFRWPPEVVAEKGYSLQTEKLHSYSILLGNIIDKVIND